MIHVISVQIAMLGWCFSGRALMTWSILIVVARSVSARAGENRGELWWPQFRGPNCSGLGGGKPPVHFGPGQNVRWKRAVGSGLSSPIVWGERVFLTEF